MDQLPENTTTATEEPKKKVRKDESIAGVFRTDELVAINALDPEILTHTARVGYDAARVKTVQPLLEAAKVAMQKQDIEWGEKVAATATAHTLREEFEARYFPCVEYAKIVHEDAPETFLALGLNESRKKSYQQFVDQADAYLGKLKSKPAYFQPLSEFSITEAHIDEMHLMLKEYIDARAKQLAESGEAETATKQRDEALEKFNIWIDRYKRVVKVALKPHPKLLSKLGL